MKRSPPTKKEKPPDVRQHIERPNADKQKRIVSITLNYPTKVGGLSFLSLAHQTQNDNATDLSDFVGNDARELPCCIYDTPQDSYCQKTVVTLGELDAAIDAQRELMQAADEQGDDLEFVDCYEKLLKLYEQFFAQRMVKENGP